MTWRIHVPTRHKVIPFSTLPGQRTRTNIYQFSESDNLIDVRLSGVIDQVPNRGTKSAPFRTTMYFANYSNVANRG